MTTPREEHAMSDAALHRAVMEALADDPRRPRRRDRRRDPRRPRRDHPASNRRQPPQQTRAVRTAARVPGVRHVEDGLRVRLMGVDGRADADTEAAALDALRADDRIHVGDIEVEMKDGAVTLSGLVEVLAQRERAERIVRGVPGVASVDNRLRVWLTVSADDVAERVTDAIGRDAILGRDSITVRVTANDVVLSGAVTSAAHRDAAVAAADAAPGVARVHDEITVADAGMC